MKISVIIPTYNEEKVIKECILSLKNQTLRDVEIIVVDDGSTDGTLGLLEDVEVFQQKHQGPAMARNLGAKHAKGKILVFVDADMTFDPRFLENLVKPIEKGKTKGTFSKEEYVSNWNNVWARSWNINSNLPAKKRLPEYYPDHQKVFRAILKSEFDRIGGFSKGGYTDDWTLSEKLGYEATAALGAIFYHKNPDSLGEIFKQAKWIGKRKYKLGVLGILVALLRSCLPISIVVGLAKSILVFKIVYDFGIFVGILEMAILGKTAK